jgi:hypothetical protein
MAENTKMPPNQDQRQRMPQDKPSGDAKPQKSGGPVPSSGGPDRDRQGVNNPGKPVPEIDPDRARPDRNRPAPGKQGPGEGSGGRPGEGSMDDGLDDEGVTPPIDRE